MSRLLGFGVVAVMIACVAGCGMSVPGMGRSGGSYKPDSVMSIQFAGDLSGAKVGQSVTYETEASGQKSSNTVKVVGQEGDNTWIEQWMDAGSMSYGYLFSIGKDKKINKAWSAAKGDKAWTAIKVTEPPKAGDAPAGEQPKAKIVESDEKKSVAAGEFASHKVETTVNVQGKDYASTAWYSKDAPKLYIGAGHGGLVAMEGSGSKTWLAAKSEDAKPTMELPTAK
ncbi:MAG: hypothetical protein H0W72_11390 [Planctomycetes bacterium]|nr:hypothetical protein [Planctomycetota bacterium]